MPANLFLSAFLIVSTFTLWGFVMVKLLYAFSGAANAAKLCRWLAWHLFTVSEGLNGFSEAYRQSRIEHAAELPVLEQQEAQA